MDLADTALGLLLAFVAAASPWFLGYDRGGLGGLAGSARLGAALFSAMAIAFGTGFVALAAFGGGALLGVDGMALMIANAWFWAPVLVVATLVAARRLPRA